MSLRIPDPSPVPAEGADAQQAPLTNPFAAGPGGFLAANELDSKRGRFSGLMVLALVVVMAGGVLMGMRRLGMGPQLALAEIKIDYPLDTDPLNASQDHERILNDLLNGGNVSRVPLEMVQTNPFSWRSLMPREAATAGTNTVDLTRQQAEQRRQVIKDAASNLILNSLMGGRVPMARIDGQLVRVGDRVGEHFTVKSIAGRAVELEGEGHIFTLKMGENEDSLPGATNPFAPPAHPGSNSKPAPRR